jgi:CRISPR/Cas system CSM-associated protein Csm3 (group 7 of RAMP superfamily)
MGRLIRRRYIVEGELEAETPLHIGAAFGGLVTDMPLAEDGAGRFYLPGTSLAGPIRSWWRRGWRDDDRLFGMIPGRGAGHGVQAEGHASFILVEDAPAIGLPDVEVRDGVGIDRRTGGAAAGIKYDREVLPRGTRFKFCITIDECRGHASAPAPRRRGDNRPEPPKWDEEFSRIARQRLGALILALETGQIRFGAAKTGGLGRVKLRDTRVTEQRIGTRAGLLARLRGQTATDNRDALVKEAKAASRELQPPTPPVEILIRWQPMLPVMNKSDVEGVSIDALPLVTGTGKRLQPVITGASVKGVLRSHAERICRTLAGVPADPRSCRVAGSERLGADFLNDVAECELVEALFGAAGNGKQDNRKYKDVTGSNARIPGLAALSFEDCLIDRPISRTAWQALLTAVHDDKKEEKAGAVRRVLDGAASGWKDFRPATHVAIDRWTGGAAENLLFSRLEPAFTGESREFRLWFDPERIAARNPCEGEVPVQLRQAAFGLLLITLRELAHGRVPIGYGTTRGLGSIAVEAIHFGGITIDDKLGIAAGGDGITFEPRDFANPDKMARFQAIEQAWRARWPNPKLGARQ